MKFVELFAGAGGLSRGLEVAGLTCVAHCEIEPHARAVLREQWPHVPLFGDVTELDGTQFHGVDLVSGGSPCQDLSVAGKRAGLEGARSGLFFEQLRVWNESGAPYLLWENVAGALSSNKGRDFAAVLSAIVGSTVHVPRDGWRGGGGVVAGRTAVAAWRVLDLQHFGPPQRRVRVFVLAARAGGVDPAEILFEPEGACRHPSPREQARKIPIASIGGGVEGGCLTPWDSESKRVFTDAAVFPTLYAAQNSGQQQQSVMALNISNGVPSLDDTMGTLDTTHAQALDGSDVVGSLLARADGSPCVDRGQPAVLCTNASKDGTGRGTPIVVPTLSMGAHTAAPGSNGQDALQYAEVMTRAQGRPRRLTPKEAERLMSWPDQWTQYGVKENGARYALSDTARYRLCGNGVASVQVQWIAERLIAAVAAQGDA
jgi:DNA (cytosine-5)-methyltransferase 1